MSDVQYERSVLVTKHDDKYTVQVKLSGGFGGSSSAYSVCMAFDEALKDAVDRMLAANSRVRKGPVDMSGVEPWPLGSGASEKPAVADHINHPTHYTSHPSGVECIDITEHMNFNVGNAVKYLWRAGLKGDALEDLQKARWYVDREIRRLEKHGK